MIELLRFYLVVLGATYLVTQSAIMSLPRVTLAILLERAAWPRGVRRYIYLGLYCPACVGFWVGLLTKACGIYGWSDAWAAEAGIVAMGLMALTTRIMPSNEAAAVELPFWDPDGAKPGVDDDETTGSGEARA